MTNKYKTYPDSELAALVMQQDTNAFEELYQRYWGLLYSFSRKMLRDDDEAKDVVQETFTKLYQHAPNLQDQHKVVPYLYQSARNAILDLVRHQKVRQTFYANFKDFYSKGEFITDHQVRENELAKLIEQEIENLPPKMRTMFELSRKQYLTHKEIAEATGASEGTVKKQLSNAIIRLRSKLTCIMMLQAMAFILWINRTF